MKIKVGDTYKSNCVQCILNDKLINKNSIWIVVGNCDSIIEICTPGNEKYTVTKSQFELTFEKIEKEKV